MRVAGPGRQVLGLTLSQPALDRRTRDARQSLESAFSYHPLQVVIGLPGQPSLLKSFALIGIPYCLEGRATGRMAILGPARMHYERVIRAMGYIGRLFQRQELN